MCGIFYLYSFPSDKIHVILCTSLWSNFVLIIFILSIFSRFHCFLCVDFLLLSVYIRFPFLLQHSYHLQLLFYMILWYPLHCCSVFSKIRFNFWIFLFYRSMPINDTCSYILSEILRSLSDYLITWKSTIIIFTLSQIPQSLLQNIYLILCF